MAKGKSPDGIGMPAEVVGAEKVDSKSLDPKDKGDASAKPKKSKGAKDEDLKILDRIRKRFKDCIEYEAENRGAAIEDLRFLAGDQWPADVKAQRNQDNRPCLTINKLPTFVHQVTNDLRQNRPSIMISPIGDKGDTEVAKMYRGLIREIERESEADIAYDQAVENQVGNGFGYFRLATEYENHDSFNQVACVKLITNPFTVYLDPNHQEPDGSDCRFQFVTEMIPRDDFKDKWPDADPCSWDQGGAGEKFKSWITDKEVRVAEYFELCHEVRSLVRLSMGWEGFEDDLSIEIKADIAAKKITIDKRRESRVPTVKYYKVSAKEILERNDWPGRWCPITPVYGDRLNIEGKFKLSGVIRHAKDAQRMVNYWETLMTELVALAPKAPYIGAAGQFEGFEEQWKAANTRNLVYLEYNQVDIEDKPAPPPQRQQFAGSPAGVMGALQTSQQDMMATTGIRFDATMNERLIDESGKAIKELRRTTDMGSYHFADNLARSLRHLGNMLVDLIPKIYDTKRVLTILRETDEEERVMIDPNAMKPVTEGQHPVTGKKLKIFNPTYGKYGVRVTIGASYATKRIEAAENLMNFAKAIPALAEPISDLIAKNLDFENSEQLATRLAKIIAIKYPGVMTPDMKDVPPQVQAMLSALTQKDQQSQQQIAALSKQLQDGEIERQFKSKEADKQRQYEAAMSDKDRQIEVAKVKLEASLANQKTDLESKLAHEKTQMDFEAKILKVVADVEKAHMANIGSQISDLSANVEKMLKAIDKQAA